MIKAAPTLPLSQEPLVQEEGHNDNVVFLNEETPRFKRILYLHLAAAIFMGIQTLAYGGIGIRDTKVNPSVGFPIFTKGPMGFPSLKLLPTMNPLWIIVLFCALASADHLVSFLFGYFKPKEAMIMIFEVKSNPLRWIEYSISASIMAIGISILCGISDVHLWLLIFVMHAIGMCMGLVLELLPHIAPESPEQTKKYVSLDFMKKFIFTLASISIFVPWLVMLCYFFYAVKHSLNPPPEFVYAAFLATLGLFITFGVNSFLHNILAKYDFATAELIYICLSFTAKTFLAADVFGGLRAASA